jgi:O-antigen/teichoic acid export membrane protein
VAIVATDLAIAVAMTVAQLTYCRIHLHERIRFHSLDWVTLGQSVTFGGALLLQAIVNQVNMNVDTMILGAVLTEDVTRTVTTYSLALTLFTMYQSLTGVMGSVFMPQTVGMVLRKASPRDLTDLVIRVGRYQMMVAGAVLGGFSIYGRDFISLWVGPAYGGAYLPALVVMIPVTIPLVQSTAISILDAQLKRMVRSIALVSMAAFNVVISILLVKWVGYVGAAIGTGLSVLLGHGVFMNYYYHRYIGLQVPRMFAEIMRGVLPAAVTTTVLCIPFAVVLPDTAPGFAAKVVLFLVLYAVLLYHGGMNESEIRNTFGVVQRVFRHA